jgi:hypothetical protein
MIQFDKDGVTLFYIDANGQRVAHNYMEGTAYDAMLTIRGAQQQAARDNTLAVANYNTELANAQISVSAGRTAAAPPKPLQKMVADADGAVTYVPFVPPLADLVPLVSTPSTVTGLINTALPAPADKQAIMYNMILAMYRKAFPDA